MSGRMNRREFLGTMAAGAALGRGALSGMGTPVAAGALAGSRNAGGTKGAAGRMAIESFDYRGVRLGDSRWARQWGMARDYYFDVSNDDILYGYRRAAGLAAPGHPLGGWCARDSSTVFGQWLQAMARASHATDDDELRAKATYLVDEWAKTLGPDGSPRMGHYAWEKLVGGLSDMHQYAGHDRAADLMEQVVDWGIANLDRARIPANREPWELHSGRPLEWYTLGENLYRAYELTGKAKYKEFGDVWRYDAYWSKFADTSDPPDALGVHAYSHCNTFSSAAMAYKIDGDPALLEILKNYYDFLQDSQCYATGGFGPAERYLKHDGALGASLEQRLDSHESPCTSWASFKLARYLMELTGEARYGDWIERVVYNGVGAALPITDNGKHFYYADYHLGAGQKVYARSTYTCCSGTYFQGTAEYQNLVYFKDPDALYVNLYLPSTVTWEREGGTVRLTQETDYPQGETVGMRLAMDRPTRFALKMRVPGWSEGVALQVNGRPASVAAKPGTWASLEREWRDGDRVELTIPVRFRAEPIDAWHPHRIAIVRGPAVYVQEIPHKRLVHPPEDEKALNEWMIATDRPGVFQYHGQEEASQTDNFRPFYSFVEMERYRMYTDPELRSDLW